MKHQWTQQELIEQFTIIQSEQKLIDSKPHHTKIGFTALLKYFQHYTHFPKQPSDVPKVIISYIAKQLRLPAESYQQYSWEGKTIKNHRAEIRAFFGFRLGTNEDIKEMRQWLKTKVLDHSLKKESLKTEVHHEYHRRKIERTTEAQIEDIVESAIYAYEQEFYESTYQKLSPTSISQMDALMESWVDMENEETGEEKEDKHKITFRKITLGPGQVSKDTLLLEINKWKRYIS